MGFLLSVLCSRGKPHSLASAAGTAILQFKEQVPFKTKNKISVVQYERKTF
jgi:hypothetical protein